MLWNETSGHCAPADVYAPPDDSIPEGDGLYTMVLLAGTGTTQPSPTHRVRVRYSGWTPDGEMFDSSERHGGLVTLPVCPSLHPSDAQFLWFPKLTAVCSGLAVVSCDCRLDGGIVSHD